MPSQSAEFFRNNVSQIIEERGMSIQALADACDMHRPNMSRIISGKENVTIERAERIAKALKVPLPKLISKKLKILQEIA